MQKIQLNIRFHLSIYFTFRIFFLNKDKYIEIQEKETILNGTSTSSLEGMTDIAWTSAK